MMTKNEFAKRQSNKVLRTKLQLEKTFNRDLKRYFAEQRRRAKAGLEIDTIEPVLQRHYNRIIRKLTGISIKQEERRIEDKISVLLEGKARERGIEIDETTREYLRRSRELAKEELAKQGNTNPTEAVLLAVASRIFGNYNRNRVQTISISETQNVVEGARSEITKAAHIELEDAILNEDKERAGQIYALSGDYSSYRAKNEIGVTETAILITLIANAMKEWRTMGDRRVRRRPRDKFDHVAANGQRVRIGEPFIVTGEQLMYPGDANRGASVGNIIKCRCVAVYL